MRFHNLADTPEVLAVVSVAIADAERLVTIPATTVGLLLDYVTRQLDEDHVLDLSQEDFKAVLICRAWVDFYRNVQRIEKGEFDTTLAQTQRAEADAVTLLRVLAEISDLATYPPLPVESLTRLQKRMHDEDDDVPGT